MKIRNIAYKLLLIAPSLYKYKKEWLKKARRRGFFKDILSEKTLPIQGRCNFIKNTLVNYGIIMALAIKIFGIRKGVRYVKRLKKNNINRDLIYKELHQIHNPYESRFNNELDYTGTPVNLINKTHYTDIISKIKSAINDDGIKVVSFDVFDTLLVRACFEPKDIFEITYKKLGKTINFNFIQERTVAESEINKTDCNFDDIYNHLYRKFPNEKETLETLKSLELETEREYLIVRRDVFDLVKLAKEKRKRLIAISDMYLDENFLQDLLIEKGLQDIKVYCSCKYNKRKDKGDLYDFVLKSERISSSVIIHIGDNYTSDYKIPLERGIVAFWIPSMFALAKAKSQLWNASIALFNDKASVFEKSVLAYSIATSGNFFEANSKTFKDKNELVWLAFAPVLFGSVIKILKSKKIQENYDQICFASRDGYLINKIYSELYNPKTDLPSVYFFAGRRLFLPSRWNNINAILKHEGIDFDEKKAASYTLRDLISEFVIGDDKKILLETIKNVLLDKKLNDIKERELDNYTKKILLAHFGNRAQFIEKYYNEIFKRDKRYIVFDVGYSGSISDGIKSVIGKSIDKLYFWQKSQNNIKSDKRLRTKTHLLFGELTDIPIGACHLIFEEICSPLQGGCLGFDQNGNPMIEKIEVSSEMRDDLNLIQNKCLTFCSQINTAIKYDWIDDNQNISNLLSILSLLISSPYGEIEYLRNIYFYDINNSEQKSLARKIELQNAFPSQSLGTGFSNPDNYIDLNRINHSKDEKELQILVHLHIYYIDLLDEVSRYIKNMGISIDLLVTTNDEKKINHIKSYFTKTCLNINKINVKSVINRGRDIAPWIIETKEVAKKYDLILHIHGKKSLHADADYANRWRHHLFDALLLEEKVSSIINAFNEDKHLGILVPSPFRDVIDIWNSNNIPIICGNRIILQDIKSRLGYSNGEILKTDLLFSVGSMLWYRPEALDSLYALDLQYNDFPEEPIPIDGTLAHAIERSMKIVCNASGYKILAYR